MSIEERIRHLLTSEDFATPEDAERLLAGYQACIMKATVAVIEAEVEEAAAKLGSDK